MIDILLAGAMAWQFVTERDPLGLPVYVAAVRPDPARPYVGVKYSCGGIIGVELQFNLGDARYSASAFSAGEPPFETVRFAFPEGQYDSTAKRAPITEGIGTYEVKGSEAAFLAGLLKDSDKVTIQRGSNSFTFPLDGARFAIDEVVSACPFKYPDP
jgi:hypothetical protein